MVEVKRDRRGQILSAARIEFAARGYSGARVNRIAERANVNKQLIFYYFGSKEGIYQAAVDKAANEVADATTSGAPASLRETLGATFQQLVEHPEGIALIVHAARSGERVTPSVARAISRPWRQIRDTISQGQGVGLVRDDVNPDALSIQAVVLLVGYLALEPVLLDLPRNVPRDAWAAAVGDSFTRILAW